MSVVARPRVLLNCAVSADGRLAYAHGARARLSGPQDLARVHRLRADSGAIVVGVGTVLLDDPSLTVKWSEIGRPPGREPIRVVLDSRGRTPAGARILDGSRPTLVATALGAGRTFAPPTEVFRAGHDRVDLGALLDELARRGVGQVLVEGGADVLASFLRGGHADALTVFVAPTVIGGATAPAMVAGPETSGPDGELRLRLVGTERLDDGIVLVWERAPR